MCIGQGKDRYKTEIYLHGPIVYQVNEPFEEIMAWIEALEDDEFAYATLVDGCRAAFRRRDVICINEYDPEE